MIEAFGTSSETVPNTPHTEQLETKSSKKTQFKIGLGGCDNVKIKISVKQFHFVIMVCTGFCSLIMRKSVTAL